MPIGRVMAGYELVEIFALEGIGLEGEVLVGAQVVYPELFSPRGFTRGLLVEKEHVGFHALRIEKASRQTQERVHIILVQEFAPDGLAGPALEQDVIRHDDG